MFQITLFVLILLVVSAHAAADCTDAASTTADQTSCSENANTPSSSQGNTTSQLPENALAQVEKLRVDIRYMRATGHPKTVQEKKDAIAEIYRTHGVPLPADFSSW